MRTKKKKQIEYGRNIENNDNSTNQIIDLYWNVDVFHSFWGISHYSYDLLLILGARCDFCFETKITLEIEGVTFCRWIGIFELSFQIYPTSYCLGLLYSFATLKRRLWNSKSPGKGVPQSSQ